jgi:hypothetical protein
VSLKPTLAREPFVEEGREPFVEEGQYAASVD